MKILIITQSFPPEPGSAAIRMFELARHLTSSGHRVNVVTSLPNYPSGVIYEDYRHKLCLREKISGATVLRLPVYTSPQRRKFLPRLLNYLSFMIVSVFGALFFGRPDLIYVYLPPPFVGFSAWFLSRLLRVPYVAEFNDLYPKIPLPGHIVNNRSLVCLSSILERFVYATAEKLFIYSRRIGNSMVEGGANPRKLELLPLWIDPQNFRPFPEEENQAWRKKFGLEDKFIVLYAGLMGLPQGMSCCLECAGLFRGRPEIIFVLVGDGPEKPYLARMKEKLGLDNVIFIPTQPKDVIPRFLSMADALLLHLKKAPHRLGTVPAKILAYMSCGRPVLAAIAGESADLVIRYECGVVVEPDNPSAMAKAIEELYHDKNLCLRLGANGRKAVVKDFDCEILLRRLEGELLAVVEQKRRQRGREGSRRGLSSGDKSKV